MEFDGNRCTSINVKFLDEKEGKNISLKTDGKVILYAVAATPRLLLDTRKFKQRQIQRFESMFPTILPCLLEYTSSQKTFPCHPRIFMVQSLLLFDIPRMAHCWRKCCCLNCLFHRKAREASLLDVSSLFGFSSSKLYQKLCLEETLTLRSCQDCCAIGRFSFVWHYMASDIWKRPWLYYCNHRV